MYLGKYVQFIILWQVNFSAGKNSLVSDSFFLFLFDGFTVMKNPANLAQHQANPKVAPIIAKMMAKFGGPK